MDSNDGYQDDEDYFIPKKRATRQVLALKKEKRLASFPKLEETSVLQPLLDLLTSFIESDDHDEENVSFDNVIQDLLPDLIQTKLVAQGRESQYDENGYLVRPLSSLEVNSIVKSLSHREGTFTPVEALAARKLKLERHKRLNNISSYAGISHASGIITPLPEPRVISAPNPQTLDALNAIRTTPYDNSFISRIQGTHQPNIDLLFCDWESRTPWMELMEDIRDHYAFSHPERDQPVEQGAPIQYGSLQTWHLDQIHDILSRVFWEGINGSSALSDSLGYRPERCTVVATYKRLVVGVAILSSPQETYITYLAVKAGWDNAQIATTMLYLLISLSPRRDITLHVSTNNPAMLLYNRFGFKAEGFIAGFYEDYLGPQSRASKNAFRLRLRQ